MGLRGGLLYLRLGARSVRSINSDGTVHTDRARDTNSNGEKGDERKRERKKE